MSKATAAAVGNTIERRGTLLTPMPDAVTTATTATTTTTTTTDAVVQPKWRVCKTSEGESVRVGVFGDWP